MPIQAPSLQSLTVPRVINRQLTDFRETFAHSEALQDALRHSAEDDQAILDALAWVWTDSPAAPGHDNPVLAALSTIRGELELPRSGTERREAKQLFLLQATECLLSPLEAPVQAGLKSLLARSPSAPEVAAAIRLLREARTALAAVPIVATAWTGHDKLNAILFALDGSRDGSKLNILRQQVAQARQAFIDDVPHQSSARAAAFAAALQEKLLQLLKKEAYAGLVADACLAQGDGNTDSYLKDARAAVQQYLSERESPTRPVAAMPGVWTRNSATSIPQPGTPILRDDRYTLQKIPNVPVEWEQFIPPTRRFVVSHYANVIRQMAEQTLNITRRQDRNRRIVLNIEDLPPFLADHPQRRLKQAEKQGVAVTAWLVAELRHQGFEVVFFQHQNRRRFLEKVGGQLQERYPEHQQMPLVKAIRTSDLILELPGLNPRNR